MEHNGLRPCAFSSFSAKDIKPLGWMRRQLEIQANGLAGNLDRVWPDVANSAWIGGSREAWERVPYWLDGFIPLAFLLEDEGLQARAKSYIDAILARQDKDGWICPCPKDKRPDYDTWALELISKVLLSWYDCTGDERIPTVLYRAFRQFYRHTNCNLLIRWGAARWFEALFALFRLYEWYKEEWILELADRLELIGTDWEKIFADWKYEKPRMGEPQWGLLHHVVNNAMMLKSRALYSRRSGEDATAFAEKTFARLMAAHGQPYGMFSGDECLAGRAPIAGLELCAVVEAMFSFETLLAITGDPKYADRAEFLGFNALPATISPDMWSHQYDQMPNQIACRILPKDAVHFTTNYPDSHLFGLEPNFGCCTSNMGQGFPKLCTSAFFLADDAIVSAILVPSRLTTTLQGANVCVSLETNYPFDGALRYTVTTDRPVAFDLKLRIPGSATSARVENENAPCGEFFTASRRWEGTQTVNVALTFAPRLQAGYEGMQSVRYGQLLFALNIDAEWHPLEYTKDGVARKFPYCDYELLPRSPWQYALSGKEFTPVPLSPKADAPLFSPNGARLALEAELTPITWRENNGIPEAAPSNPSPTGDPVKMRLIPYGCTDLRISVFPDLTQKNKGGDV